MVGKYLFALGTWVYGKLGGFGGLTRIGRGRSLWTKTPALRGRGLFGVDGGSGAGGGGDLAADGNGSGGAGGLRGGADGGGSVTLQKHGGHGAFGFLGENELAVGVEVDADEVSQLDLPGGHQIGQREHEIALDGALEVAGAILGSVPSCSRKLLTVAVQLKTNWLLPVRPAGCAAAPFPARSPGSSPGARGAGCGRPRPCRCGS